MDDDFKNDPLRWEMSNDSLCEIDANEELLGAILIPSAFDSDTTHDNKQWDSTDYYFALITGKLETDSNIIEYHIRHLSDPTKNILTREINIFQKGFSDHDMVIVKLNAKKMFQ